MMRSSAARALHRTLLFAPGSRPELLAKAQTGAADALIFDLEDSVPAASKAEARAHVAQAFDGGLSKPTWLRINHPDTAAFAGDMDLLSDRPLPGGLAGVIVPKAESAGDLARVAQALTGIERAARIDDGTLTILPLIETCAGLRNGYELASAGPRVCGIALASAEQGDFIVDLGGRWTPRSLALAYPRSKLVVDARAAGLQWIVDGVFMNLKDPQALRAECEIARELGFVGKMAIHPTQVETMHEVFSPTPAEIAYARGLLAAFREAEARGIGAVKYEGMMIDYANVRLAERTIALAGAAPGGCGPGECGPGECGPGECGPGEGGR